MLKKLDLPSLKTIQADQCMYSSAIETLILRKTDAICTLGHINCLQETPIAAGTGYIYVPSALLSTYKAATNWVTYASQIRAIEDYPDITGG